ncbi:MAG TPA: HAD family phosphatase [Nitrospira sp.]|nr:HAD family phosphatase [Nitrospira sp.]
MIRAIVFDFNGVIVDDETPHLVCFQQALIEARLALTKEEYYGAYLGMDERTCAALLLERRDGTCDEKEVVRIAERKAELFRVHTARHKPLLFRGVVEFVKAATGHYSLAIASGGRKEQIQEALAGSAIECDFEVIVAAEDCPIGKPDPAIYLMTLERLNGRRPASPMRPEECLVLEDSLAGIRSAKAADMRVVALATTYPVEKLYEADGVVRTLEGLTPEAVIGLLS